MFLLSMTRSFFISRVALFVALASVVLLQISCATYESAPLVADQIAARQAAATIDRDAVRARLERLAPGYRWNAETWNALTLFAAALVASPEAVLARKALAAAETGARAARQAPGPSFTLTAEYAFNPSESSPWLLGAAGDLLLGLGGRGRARIEAADILLAQANFDYAQALWTIRMSVCRALVSTRFGDATTAAATALVTLKQRQFEAAQRRAEAGEIARADVERVRAELAAALVSKSDAAAAEARARLDLAAAVGVAPGALEGIVLAAGPTVDSLPAAPPQDAIDGALAARGEILNAATDYDRAESEYRAAVAAQFPEVRIGPGYTWERGLSKLPAAVTLGFPSWDLNAAAIRAAAAARADAGARLEAAVATVSASIRTAQAGYEAARAALALAEAEILPTAAALARQAEHELAAGALDRADWAAVQAGFAAAQLDRINTERRVAETFLALEDALHRPLAGDETRIGVTPGATGEPL
ncbi:MAG: TolC family protein [Pseudomonadales bacterium]